MKKFKVCIVLYIYDKTMDLENKIIWQLYTFEVNVKSTELQFCPLQCLSECLMVVTDALLWSCTEWQGEVGISLLSVVVGTNSVHPQNNLLSIFILQSMKKIYTSLFISFSLWDL